MNDYGYLNWCDAAARIRAQELSPVEYTQALLDRIAAHNDTLHAFLRVDEAGALAAAQRAEQAVAAGDELGPMHGVPFALKDIVDRAGEVTSCHSRVLMDNVADTDAEITKRLLAAGGIYLGKLATHEFAIGGPCFDLPWPPARNPWDPRCFTGGSSSGSGAAVAAGMVPMAIGTDTAGSVRNPATACGIVGMKPTYGRVSRRGVFPLAYSLDTVGPMTRTVAENAAMLNVIAGFDGADPGSAARGQEDFGRDLGRGVAGVRIGYVRHFHSEDLKADPEVSSHIEQAVEVLAGLGGEVREIKTRALPEFAECNRVLLLSEAYAVHEQWLQHQPHAYGALTRERLSPGAFLRAVDYVQAMRMRRILTSELSRAMREVDVLVLVSSHDPPCRIDDDEAVNRTYQRQARAPFNLTGQPALAMPCGFTADGLPIGWQIAARAFDEALIYRVAHAYEQAAGWFHRRAPLDGSL